MLLSTALMELLSSKENPSEIIKRFGDLQTMRSRALAVVVMVASTALAICKVFAGQKICLLGTSRPIID